MLAPAIEAEIAALAARYGAPRRVVVQLPNTAFKPLISADRIGEVCMVIRRRNGKLLTAIKTFYPPGAFRLLTGGVGPGESIEAALRREVAEETGLEVVVRRFLAVIEYRQGGEPGTENQDLASVRRSMTVDGRPTTQNSKLETQNPDPCFVTFVFLLDEVGGELGVQDATEQLGAFREVAVEDLPAIADTLECMPDVYHPEVGGSWRDWGHFRAVVHRVVYELLREAPPASSRAWLMRIVLSLAIAAGSGALAYLIARAVTSVMLLVQQRAFLRQLAGAMRSGIVGLAGSDLHTARLLVQQLAARYEHLSLLIGFAAAALGAAVSYLWLEWRAEPRAGP